MASIAIVRIAAVSGLLVRIFVFLHSARDAAWIIGIGTSDCCELLHTLKKDVST